jgi:hypothetical protein
MLFQLAALLILPAAVKVTRMNRLVHEYVHLYTAPLTCHHSPKLAQSASFRGVSTAAAGAKGFGDDAGTVIVHSSGEDQRGQLHNDRVYAFPNVADPVFDMFSTGCEREKRFLSIPTSRHLGWQAASKNQSLVTCREQSSLVRWAVRFTRVESWVYPSTEAIVNRRTREGQIYFVESAACLFGARESCRARESVCCYG